MYTINKEKMKDVGKRLQTVRKFKNYTQKEFGIALGGENDPISDTTISKYESGTLEISARAKLALITSWKVNPDFLENGSLPMFVNDIDNGESAISQILWLKEKVNLLERIAALQDEIQKLKAKN